MAVAADRGQLGPSLRMKQRRLMLAELSSAVKQAVKAHSNVEESEFLLVWVILTKKKTPQCYSF